MGSSTWSTVRFAKTPSSFPFQSDVDTVVIVVVDVRMIIKQSRESGAFLPYSFGVSKNSPFDGMEGVIVFPTDE
jgi:hypothetical protein